MIGATAFLTTAPSAPQVPGLHEDDQALLNEMFTQWKYKLPRNIERLTYLDGKSKLKDLKIVLPPQLVDSLEVAMGWPEKAVYEPANRVIFERLLSPDEDRDPFGLRTMLRENRFELEFPQAVVSSMAQSTAFATVTPGDVASGEPEQMLMFHSALYATGLWDRRRRALKAGLLINRTDALGAPTQLTLLLDRELTVCTNSGRGWFVESKAPNRARRPPMEALPFRPTLDRPFGRSRIDRQVMSLTDRAMRNAARLEVHSELFSMVKLILMGADADNFTDDKGNQVPLWSWYAGMLNTLSKDADGDVPTLEQVTAQSPEPHIAVGRDLASKFSGHTGVPLSSLGIATDNPESADSKRVAREDIVNDVEKQHLVYEASLLRLFQDAVMMRDGLTERPDEVLDLSVKFRRADRPTLVSLADAGAKQLSSLPQLQDTEVGMELAGLDQDQIERAQGELARQRGPGVLDNLMARKETDDPVQQANAMKARFDALGVAIRAGVDPNVAAARVGLEGLSFTGAPVSVRLSDSDAARLEER